MRRTTSTNPAASNISSFRDGWRVKMLTGGVTRTALWAQLCLCLALAVSLPCQRFANAQVLYGTLVWTVLDQSNTVVAGATIAVTNSGTGKLRAAITNAVRAFSLPNVEPGTYVLK